MEQEVSHKGTQMCADCGKTANLLDFQRPIKNGYPRFKGSCNDCATVKLKQWKSERSKAAYENLKQSEKYEQHRQRLRNNSHKRKFDIDPQTYQRLFTEQKGLCACCGHSETMINNLSGFVKLLAVDHNHETGEIRALLCTACNISYGLLEESPSRIKALLLYAEKNLGS